MSRFDEVTEVSPEPAEVFVDYSVCPEHGFNMINVPRDMGSDAPRRVKCPLNTCSHEK